MIGTGYELTKAFYRELNESEMMQLTAKPHHFSLYAWIAELRNRLKQEVIELPVLYTMQMTLIGSQHTLAKAIDDLSEWKIIEVLMQTKGHGTKVKFAIAFLQKHCNSEGAAIANMQLQCNSDADEPKAVKDAKAAKAIKTKTTVEFDHFWNQYGKKSGSKPNAVKEWNKLTKEQQQQAVEGIDRYRAYQPDPQFRKDPERYLNKRVWESEFETSANQPINGNGSNGSTSHQPPIPLIPKGLAKLQQV